MKALFVGSIGLLLLGCQVAPGLPEEHSANWRLYFHNVSRMDPAQLHIARQSAIQSYENQRDDDARLRLAYVLSRRDASAEQLAQSRVVLNQIPDQSDIAPLRDLLLEQVAVRETLLNSNGRIRELQAQLEALKDIEAETIENRKEMENQKP